MVKRFLEKRNKNGRLIRVGRIVPFTLDQLRTWLLGQLGGSAMGCVQCAYCIGPLTAEDLRVEHPTPVSRGGTLGFENLAVSCDDCNRLKGELTAEEFGALKDAMDAMLQVGHLAPAGYKDIIKRLKGQVAIFRRPKEKARPVATPESQQEQVPF